MHIYTDGTILISHGGTEMGQGLHTKVCQVAARALGVPLSACHVAETASDKVPNAITTAGSMSTELYGMAVLDACRQLVHRLQPLREKLGAGASLAQLATAAWFSRIDLCAHGYFSLDGRRCGFDFGVKPGVKPDGTPDQTTRGNLHNYYTQGVGCVEVEIDVLTGDHEVLRADMLVDLGSSINPALDIGQIEGGFTQVRISLPQILGPSEAYGHLQEAPIHVLPCFLVLPGKQTHALTLVFISARSLSLTLSQGMGWTTTEELIWGDEEHAWVKPGGRLHTSGPGTYKMCANGARARRAAAQRKLQATSDRQPRFVCTRPSVPLTKPNPAPATQPGLQRYAPPVQCTAHVGRRQQSRHPLVQSRRRAALFHRSGRLHRHPKRGRRGAHGPPEDPRRRWRKRELASRCSSACFALLTGHE